MRRIAVLALGFLTWGSLRAQELAPCGMGAEEGFAIKADMMALRQRISDEQLRAIRQRRNTIYVPTTIHIVGDDNGSGYARASSAVGMICRLNADFADQDIRFFLNEPPRYLDNQTIFNDAYSQSAIQTMGAAKVSNTLNIYVSRNTSRPVAGYYSRGQDFVYMQTGSANSLSSTITHEVGHFFTLPHTFVGWESLDVVDLYGSNPVPSSLGGNRRAVENVPRTGPDANCETASDGFCDTPADYMSGRLSCPFRAQVLDPNGIAIVPDDGNYMSYFSDNCMTHFSQEQQDAMLRNIIDRNWHLVAEPNWQAFQPGASASTGPVYPAALELVDIENYLNLEWQPIAGAMGYWLEVERTLIGVPVETLFEGAVTSTSIALNASLFRSNSEYIWRVQPFNAFETCQPYSPYYQFTSSDNIIVSNSSLEAQQFSWSILAAQPFSGSSLPIEINVPDASEPLFLEFYDFQGRRLLAEDLGNLPAGKTLEYLQVDALSAGVYVLCLRRGKQLESKKIILR